MPWQTFINGADLSYVNQIERSGGAYKDSGQAADAFVIFKNHGCNLVQVRLWHNPAWSVPLNGGMAHADFEDAKATIRRARNAGMAALLDLHHSGI